MFAIGPYIGRFGRHQWRAVRQILDPLGHFKGGRLKVTRDRAGIKRQRVDAGVVIIATRKEEGVIGDKEPTIEIGLIRGNRVRRSGFVGRDRLALDITGAVAHRADVALCPVEITVDQEWATDEPVRGRGVEGANRSDSRRAHTPRPDLSIATANHERANRAVANLVGKGGRCVALYPI